MPTKQLFDRHLKVLNLYKQRVFSAIQAIGGY